MRRPAPDIFKKFEPNKSQYLILKYPPKKFLANAQKAVLTYFVRSSFKYLEFEWH